MANSEAIKHAQIAITWKNTGGAETTAVHNEYSTLVEEAFAGGVQPQAAATTKVVDMLNQQIAGIASHTIDIRKLCDAEEENQEQKRQAQAPENATEHLAQSIRKQSQTSDRTPGFGPDNEAEKKLEGASFKEQRLKSAKGDDHPSKKRSRPQQNNTVDVESTSTDHQSPTKKAK